MEVDEYIELYSKNRNRLLYPNPSTFEVPYAPTTNIAQNPVINGTIYYKFSYQPGDNPTIGVFNGTLSEISNLDTFYLDPSMTPYYPAITNFFVGYTIKLAGSSETRVITSYDPSTGRVGIDKPYPDGPVYPPYSLYQLYLQFPTFDHISIPTVDINGNIGLDYEGAYNGYYAIFETKYKAYSNEYNSNIFYRKITYYDNKTRLGYFDRPINFDYKDEFGYEDLQPQFITLRKTLPLERWTLTTSTYYNKTPPSDPIIGPLIGPVITLPVGASLQDNYYKGKYVYYYANNAYYGEINFIRDLELKDQFYPIYGFYFIKAYNGKTRELSVEQDINNISCNQSLPNIPLPGLPTKVSLYNSSSLIGYYYSTVSQVSGDLYRANINLPPATTFFSVTLNPPGFGTPYVKYWEIGKLYTIRWRLRKSASVNLIYLYSIDGADPSILSVPQQIFNDYITIEKSVIFTGFYIDFVFTLNYVNPINNPYIEWDLFEIVEETVINITDFDKDSYSPFDYIGTTVSSSQDVCYEVALTSLTLPNLLLKTGSKIAFYPYVYVELSNITSPNSASNEIIYSNNPNSNRALFVVPVGLLVNPNSGTFLTLYSDMTQFIKFKPNDNLKFSVYLPNGEPFQTFLNDTFPPYDPDSRVQIEAVFKILRKLYLN